MRKTGDQFSRTGTFHGRTVASGQAGAVEEAQEGDLLAVHVTEFGDAPVARRDAAAAIGQLAQVLQEFDGGSVFRGLPALDVRSHLPPRVRFAC